MYILKNFTMFNLFILKIFDFIKILRTKQLKNIVLFILFYLFLNLYLFPTLALCEIDPNLLNRENNTYKGSKIVYETPDEIITQGDIDTVKKAARVYDEFFYYGMSILIIYYIMHLISAGFQ